ncbi:CSL zinc finger domain-containing protein [Cryptosporidium muris RN66]|uniref:CSL zinc finger domain-containing protein n=1 Tax=Cryptosporidium muris (strain RN66) TaxID=441375 RepID=B6AGA3_CRYMR|nr:CSL zinc finger domain-containing protein [Cryptosporidium muris RN66]EEA07244.1 CSL zinc finger domain-containing protein [Cryptosporidium muris RN66]|eukprot:XP_002141593.1 CSL zinc finger domain-containing protein [Cryptosporidium muris RN66]
MNNLFGIIWKEIKLLDMKWFDYKMETLSYDCSCGDIFLVKIQDLEMTIADPNSKTQVYSIILQCESCSLKLRLIFDKESLELLRKTPPLEWRTYSVNSLESVQV